MLDGCSTCPVTAAPKARFGVELFPNVTEAQSGLVFSESRTFKASSVTELPTRQAWRGSATVPGRTAGSFSLVRDG